MNHHKTLTLSTNLQSNQTNRLGLVVETYFQDGLDVVSTFELIELMLFTNFSLIEPADRETS